MAALYGVSCHVIQLKATAALGSAVARRDHAIRLPFGKSRCCLLLRSKMKNPPGERRHRVPAAAPRDGTLRVSRARAEQRNTSDRRSVCRPSAAAADSRSGGESGAGLGPVVVQARKTFVALATGHRISRRHCRNVERLDRDPHETNRHRPVYQTRDVTDGESPKAVESA